MRPTRRRLRGPLHVRHENHDSVKVSSLSNDLPSKILDELACIMRHNRQLQEQISMIHGAFEELCERQESSHTVQVEFASRMTALHELHVDSVTNLMKFIHGKCYENQNVINKSFVDSVPSTQFDSAIQVSLSGEKSLLRKRAFRLRALARHSRRLQVTSLDAEVVLDDAILVLPENSEVH